MEESCRKDEKTTQQGQQLEQIPQCLQMGGCRLLAVGGKWLPFLLNERQALEGLEPASSVEWAVLEAPLATGREGVDVE